jgi:trans-2,3-dihydro-3-hydroxyanthranilate isomerase
MPSYEFVTVDVFAERRFGGNPLAVFPDAEGLSDAAMQALAAEFNLSETTFVLPPDNPQHHARVRIFTPRTELPFAGHPNVGTGYVLAGRTETPPEHFTFEQGARLVRVHILRDADDAPTGARVSAPHSLSMGIGVPTETIAACAGLAPEDIATDMHEPLVASVGMAVSIAEVTDVATLARANPDIAAFRDAVSRFPDGPPHFPVLLYARRDGDALRPRVRMFAPLLGIMEDPATGSANAALAALLTALAPGDNLDLAYDIEQGIEMGRPSRLFATARKTGEGPVTATVGGSCVPMMRGRVDL